MTRIKSLLKSSTILLVLVVLLLAGFSCTRSQRAEGNISRGIPKPPAEVLKPLKLVYTVKNFGPRRELTETIWIESKEQCSKREAYYSVVKIESLKENFSPIWAKAIIFADNGDLVMSRFGREDNLAFDNLVSEYNEFNIPTIFNSIFAYANKNFNSPEVWSATVPILLKRVDSGQSLTDYSFIRQEENTAGVLPCQKFKVVAKGTNFEGTANGCVAQGIGQVKVPLIVSFSLGEGGPAWELKSYAEEKSGVASVPQCLERVRCTYVPELSETDQRVCRSQGGQVEPNRNDQGCTLKYQCLTAEQIVDQAITRSQRPGCPIKPELKNRLLQCRKQNQPNFDVIKYDEGGCALNAVCRP